MMNSGRAESAAVDKRMTSSIAAAKDIVISVGATDLSGSAFNTIPKADKIHLAELVILGRCYCKIFCGLQLVDADLCNCSLGSLIYALA